jgi:hypothetical protein
LASNFRYKLRFAFASKQWKEVVDRFDIKNFPSLIILSEDDDKPIIRDDSEDWDLQVLSDMIAPFAADEEIMYDLPNAKSSN